MPNEPQLRAAVFGLGGGAERIHLPALAQLAGVELVAGCDPDPAAREKAEKRFGLPRSYAAAAELLAVEKIDLALVGTPPDTHAELCRLALDAGAHVFCEKPFTETLDEANALIAHARRADRLLVVNNQYRYMPIYRRTQERIAAGDFGRLYAAQCWQQMLYPTVEEPQPWRARMERAVLYEFGTHALDLLCYLFDALPETIACNLPRVRPEYRSDVLVQAVLRFPEDRLATVWFNRVSHAPKRYLEMRLDCTEASLRVSLGGLARASLEWTGVANPRLSLLKGGEARSEAGGKSRVYARMGQPAFMSASADHLRDFVAAIRRGDHTLDSVIRSRNVLAVALAGYDSAAREGAPVGPKYHPG